MIIHPIGLCAIQNPLIAAKAINKAKDYINENTGVCLTGAAVIYLGDMGALSNKEAKIVFPIIEKSLKIASLNEIDWILESFYKIFKNSNKIVQENILKYSKRYTNSSKKSQQKRANKILAKFAKEHNNKT